jgi:hypothetical protein
VLPQRIVHACDPRGLTVRYSGGYRTAEVQRGYRGRRCVRRRIVEGVAGVRIRVRVRVGVREVCT